MTKFEKAEIIAYVLGLILCGCVKVHHTKKMWALAERALQEMAAKQIARYRQEARVNKTDSDNKET